jgi:hypothetical protein
MSSPKPRRRWLRILGGIVVVFVLAIAAISVALHHAPTPTTPGPDAEALAHEMVRAVDGDAWARTGAVHWRMLGHEYLWDKNRNLARVEWRGKRVLLDVAKRSGRAFVDGKEVDGAARDKLVERAYAFFINDSFWLNPVVKAFDDGTARARGSIDGKRALLVSYSSGGLTPGDRYLWILDDNGRPERWRLWVKVLPIGGLEVTWDGWQQLSTGAWVATRHRALGLDGLKLADVRGAATLAELEPQDPFAPLL